MRKALLDTNRRELDSKPSLEMNAPFHGFDQLRGIGVAWIEPGIGIDNANYGARERFIGVSQGLNEDFSQE